MTRALISCALFLMIGEERLFAETKLSPEALLQEASDIAATIQEPASKSWILQSIVRAQLRAGDIQGALKTASTMSINRSNTLASVLTAQAKLGDIKGANQTLSLIDEESAKKNALGALAVAYAKAGDTQKALQLVAQIPDNYAAQSGALVDIAKLQAAGGDTEGAVKTLAEKWQVNPYAVWEILEPKLAAGDTDGALQITSSIQDEYFKSYMLWGVTTRVKDLNRRLEIAASIPTGHARASAFKLAAVQQLAGGDVQGGRSSLLRAMEGIPSIHNIWAKADIQWQIAKTFAEAQDIPNARSVAVSIEQKGHREVALKDIIAVQAKAKDYAGALETASLEKSDDTLRDYALDRIAVAQATSGSMDRTLETIGKIRNEKSRWIAFGSVAMAYAEAGNIAATLHLAGRLRHEYEKAEQILESSETKEKLRLGDEDSRQIVNDWHTLRQKLDFIFGGIALSRSKSGGIQEALGFTNLISKEFLERIRVIEEIALDQVKAGDIKGAMEWISASKSPSEKSSALVGVSYGLLRSQGS